VLSPRRKHAGRPRQQRRRERSAGSDDVDPAPPRRTRTRTRTGRHSRAPVVAGRLEPPPYATGPVLAPNPVRARPPCHAPGPRAPPRTAPCRQGGARAYDRGRHRELDFVRARATPPYAPAVPSLSGLVLPSASSPEDERILFFGVAGGRRGGGRPL
jgi:hypothetical protein